MKNDSAVDIDGAHLHARPVRQAGATRSATCARCATATRVQARQGAGLPVAARAGADARRGAVHQRLQLPGLGPVGEGRRRRCCRACRSSSSPPPRPPGSRSAWCATWSTPACCRPARCRSICGSSAGLMDQLQPFDVVSFTGSAETGAVIRCAPGRGPALGAREHRGRQPEHARCCCPTPAPGSDGLRPARARSGARDDASSPARSAPRSAASWCRPRSTTPRPKPSAPSSPSVTVGNPRNESVRMGSLVSRAQLDAVRDGLAQLQGAGRACCTTAATKPLVDADPAVAACVGPVLLGARDADAADRVHDVEVFGPVATLLPYRDLGACAWRWPVAARARSSPRSTAPTTRALGAGRAGARRQPRPRARRSRPRSRRPQTGHGNVMPHVAARRPGRAGGGAELGGLRALDFYHRRSAVQASPARAGRSSACSRADRRDQTTRGDTTMTPARHASTSPSTCSR